MATNTPVNYHDNGLDIQIKISEITTSPSGSNEVRRNWFEVQKYNSHSSETGNIDLGVIDIDEVSGSGLDDDNTDDIDTFIPLPTENEPSRDSIQRADNSKTTVGSTSISNASKEGVSDHDFTISGIIADKLHSTISGKPFNCLLFCSKQKSF